MGEGWLKGESLDRRERAKRGIQRRKEVERERKEKSEGCEEGWFIYPHHRSPDICQVAPWRNSDQLTTMVN